jgi:hypothetical protein
MNTFRKLAREAVIFMLLGPVVAAPAIFTYLQRRSLTEIKAEAARAVYAFDVKSLPPGFRLDNSVLVPLTNGVQLNVTDCAQAHPWVISSTPVKSAAKPADLPAGLTPLQSVESGSKNFEQIPPGATNGTDCVYFKDELSELTQKYGGHLDAVPLGDVNQVQIEKDYWAAYAKANSQARGSNAIETAFFSLWGFPTGIIVWLFYRLVRFAVKG